MFRCPWFIGLAGKILIWFYHKIIYTFPSFFFFFSEITSKVVFALCSSTIRDKIIPHAVSWFTGEAVQGDEFEDIEDDDDEDGDDEDEEDEEDEDEEEDDEDEDEEEEDKSRKKVKILKRPQTVYM